MSASNKKKLRKEQESAKLTEKQQSAQKEAKKLNLYTTLFVVVILALLVIAIFFGVKQAITSSGIREKNTVALTVGDHEISNAEMNYYFLDSVNNFYSSYGSYASMFGLDTTKPLNEQVLDEETGMTWADDFLASAKDSAVATYAMVDAAEAAGFTLPETAADEIANQVGTMDVYATLYGYSDGESYLKAIYGNGSTLENYQQYLEARYLADAYYSHYAQSLTYEDAQLRELEKENYDAYSSYNYNTYYLAASKFRTGGTTDAEGNTTYSDEEIAASVAAAEEAAKALTAGDITTLEALDEAIAALPINAGTEAASTASENVLYSSISTTYADWVTDSSRKAGDMTYVANTSTTTNEDGTEETTVSGYYVLFFNGSNDNNFAMKNVRHILLSFQHDHDESEEHDHSTDGYTEEEKAEAKALAESIYQEWKDGGATEELFAELANNKSADSDGISGGLYENIYPGQMVTNFNDWCYDEARKPGDSDIIETEYGYHIMYFVGDSEQTYRDYQIENQLRNADVNEWYTQAAEAMTLTEGNTDYIKKDLVINAG